MSHSGSDMSSDALDSSGESSSEWDDSRGPSPRDGDAALPPPSRPAPAGLRIPSLALRANLEALPRDGGYAGNSAPGTARQPSAVPRLALPGVGAPAACGTPRGAAPPLPPPKQQQQQQQQQVDMQQPVKQQHIQQPQQLQQVAPAAPPPQQHAGQATQLSLDVLSPALTLNLQQGSAATAQRCAAQLGVAQGRLRFYALTEVAAPEQLPPGCARAAVEVEGSTFSLAELEKLVAENQQLKEAAAAAAAAAEASAARQAAASPRAAGGADVRALQAKLRAVQAENEALRQQVRQSESLRRKGKKALAELKQEFDALSRELMLGQASVLGFAKRPPALALPGHSGGAPPPALGTPAALSDALQQF